MTRTAIALAALALGACTAQPHGDGHIGATGGVPVLAGIYSSGIQITPDEALTVAHGVPFGNVVKESQRYDAMLVKHKGKPVEIGERVTRGQRVIVRGSGMFGEQIEYETAVDQPKRWACEPFAKPEAMYAPKEGTCTSKGQAYTYGFSVPQGPISTGFSGGGVYDLDGRVVGMIAQTGTPDRSKKNPNPKPIGWAYHIADLKADLQWSE